MNMVALFLTFLSLLLTVVVGAVFLLGVHRLVLLVVTYLESRSAEPTAESVETSEIPETSAHRPVLGFSLRGLARR